MKKVAVTGGTGFIGAVVIDQLLDSGIAVAALARDATRLKRRNEIDAVPGSLGDEASLARLVEGADAVLHLAGETHAPSEQDYTRINVKGAASAASAASSSTS